MDFRFKATPEFIEAISAGAGHARTGVSFLGGLSLDVNTAELVLSNKQVSAILSGLEFAIQSQLSDYGDWDRAQSFTEARSYLLSETRRQYESMKSLL